jgi:hypothetical protein
MGRILPLPLTRRPSPCYNRSLYNRRLFSFSSLSLTRGARSLVSLPYSFSPFPHRLTPHRVNWLAPRPHARMGRSGRQAGKHTELARTPMTQYRGSTGEGSRFPLLPSPGDAKGAQAATSGWPRRRPGVSSNWGAPTTILPLRRLDRDPKGDPETLAAPHQPTWGFPLLVSAAAGEGGEWRRGKKNSVLHRRRRAAARSRP